MNFALRLHLMLFPPACRQCRRMMDPLEHSRPGFPFLCTQCHAGLGWMAPERSCRRCGRWTAEPHRLRCPGCADERMDLDGVVATCHYTDPVRHWIRSFKYHRQDNLAPMLGRLLAESPSLAAQHGRDALAAAHLMMPVPLHPRRIRSRGFNQSYLLARQATAALRSQERSVPLLETRLLKRHKNTRPQVEMPRKERYANVVDAFSVDAFPVDPQSMTEPAEVPPRGDGSKAGHPAILGRNVILVDDVMTTGATLNACARVLKAAGAATVTALVLARM